MTKKHERGDDDETLEQKRAKVQPFID